MVSEYNIGWIFSGGLIGLVVATILYWLGGRHNNIIRRLGSAATLALTVNLEALFMGNWNTWLLLIFPLLFGGFSLGYGADTTGGKFLRRLLYALGVCLSGTVFFSYSFKTLFLLIPHIVLGLVSIYFGIKNPVYAPVEEGIICVLLNLMLISYPFLKLIP